MFIFACAGLDAFVKLLIKTKLPKLINADSKAQDKFKEHVKREMKSSGADNLNMIALALIDSNPKDIFLKEYIEKITKDSLQSVQQLRTVCEASALDTGKIFTNEKMNLLRDAFTVRNEIVHEMDINLSEALARTSGYRTRRQRVSSKMEKHTKTILDLAQEIFTAYQARFEEFKLETKKG
jgi:hypothetical protein